MSETLEAYLEEIGHYLSGRKEREEILAEIRSHILEKATQEHGDTAPDSLDKVIAVFGPARRVAESYLDGGVLIAPAYNRFLFRYTSFLFAVHLACTVFALVFKQSFALFPVVYMPRLGILEALLYLPTAFLADLGLVFLILMFITRGKRDARLPWPKFAVDIDQVRPPKQLLRNIIGFLVALAITGFLFHLFLKHGAIFFANLNFDSPRLLFTAEAGRRISLLFIALFALGAAKQFAKIFTPSPWVDVSNDALALVFLGLLLRVPLESAFAASLPDRHVSRIEFAATFVLIFIIVAVAFDLVKSLVLLGRKRKPGS